MSIENPTLAHFRHFSSLFTNLPSYKALYLPAYKAANIYLPIRHYICRESSTNQTLFIQNKPNSPNVQIYINIYNTMDYQNFIPLAGYKNKPNSNPIKPNSRKAKMNVNLTLTKDYRKKDDFSVRINKSNFVKGPKCTQTLFHKRIMIINHLPAPKKQTQNKPNFAYPKGMP